MLREKMCMGQKASKQSNEIFKNHALYVRNAKYA